MISDWTAFIWPDCSDAEEKTNSDEDDGAEVGDMDRDESNI